MPGKKILLTDDGSHTVFSERFQSTYHSTHGAIQESKHVFIKHGLSFFHNSNNKPRVRILEYGFGTGLNALLSLRYAVSNRVFIEYTGLEAYPLSLIESKGLNYTNNELLLPFSSYFDKMHLAENITGLQIPPYFLFNKYNRRFEDISLKDKFDIIYFDVFSPDIQSHLWERPFLDQVISNLLPEGILITYGAKGAFKRSLKSLGLKIENPPGPPGKREITRAQRILNSND